MDFVKSLTHTSCLRMNWIEGRVYYKYAKVCATFTVHVNFRSRLLNLNLFPSNCPNPNGLPGVFGVPNLPHSLPKG